MVQSTTEIANLALGHLAVSKQVSDLTNLQERTAEALACRRFFNVALDRILGEFPWPFATRFAFLGLIEELEDEEWTYSYQYPADCVTLRRLLSGKRMDTEDTQVPYRLVEGAAGHAILTDQEDAQAEYTGRITDVLRYPADFTMAFSYLLAFMIAPSVTQGDQFKLGERAGQLYFIEVERAKARAFNEQRRDLDPEPEMIRARY